MKRRKCLLLTIVILMFACLTVQADDGFAISQTKATINIGDTLELSTTGTDKTPSWTSYNDNIVKVSTYGEITGLKKGKTTVRARVGSACKTCAVTVVDSSIKLNKRSAVIYHGGTSKNTVQLKATVKGAYKDIAWKSSDTDIAVVDDTGKVTSVSEGSAVITAASNSKSVSCVITVKESSLSLNMDNIQLSTRGIGSSIKITPAITGSAKNTRWTTSDKTIATVSGGKITGKKTGTATITAEANGVSAVCEVRVVEGLISINEEKVILYVGGTKQETKKLKTNAAKTEVVTWKSSNTDAVTVDGNGIVTPISVGTAVISAECNGKTDTCEVTVKQTSINIKEDSVFLKTKGTDKKYTLNNEIVGRSRKVKWTTSDKKVATVSNGRLTAKKAGMVTVTAAANGVSDSVVVYVVDYDPSITLNYARYTLFTVKGNTVNLKASVDGSNKTVEWQSSDPSVATVTNKGKVSAVNEGTAVITAKANGVTAECLITVKESRVIFNRDNISLDKGEVLTIGYDVVGTKQSVKWSTADSRVVSVKNGILTAKEYGEADIKATANGVTSICHVNVVSCKHQYENTVTKQPTCAETGTMTYVCSLCGNTYTEEIPATGDHDWGEWETVVPPTSETAGTKKRTCARCGEAEEQEIPPLVSCKHKYVVNTVTKQPTCAETGTMTYVCSLCGNTTYTRELPATGDHSYEWITVSEPTCTEKGRKAYGCAICGRIVEEQETEALGHDFGEWVVVKEATETEEGIEERTCLRCGEKEINTIHDYIVYEVVHPTCQLGGYTVYICTECGDIYNDDHTEPDPEAHALVEYGQEPSCTSSGYYEVYCKNEGCKYGYYEESEPALGHDYQILEEDRKEYIDYYGNETSYGYYIEECSRCGRHYEEYTITPYCENTEWDEKFGDYIIIDPDGYEGQIKFDSFMREELLPYVTFNLRRDYGDGVSLSEDGHIKISGSEIIACDVVVSLKDNPYNASISNYDQTYISFYVLSPTEAKVRQVIDEEIKDDMNDAEKILAIHNWLCLNCEYDFSFDNSSFYAYGAILNGKAVCNGYAMAFKLFMDKLGIECKHVSSVQLDHAWNQVKIEDEWYWLDCTWDDIGDKASLSYFLWNGARAGDERGGTDCTGTKWKFGGPIFQKYKVLSYSDMNDVYLMQKDNQTLYFMLDSNADYMDKKHLFNLGLQYKDKYQAELYTNSISIDEENIVYYFPNSDRIKALFEERIARGDTNDVDRDDSTELTEEVNCDDDEPDAYEEQEPEETGDVNEPDDGVGSDAIAYLDVNS